MAKLAALAVLASLLGTVSCELSISLYLRWGYPPPSPGRPYPLPAPCPPLSPTPALKVGYYADKNCPDAESIVRDAVWNATAGEKAGLIRLFFHDCFVEGCDASVLLKKVEGQPDPEMLGVPNLSLRGLNIIDKAKEALEAKCPGIVSCADILAFAGRDASYNLSYRAINYNVPAGRLDGKVSLASETLGKNLPPPFGDLNLIKAMFAAKGLDEKDMVVLSGAHSTGRSGCSSFSTAPIEPVLGNQLNQTCGMPVNEATTVPQDFKTPDALDVQYYRNIQSRHVLFESDATLTTSPQTKRLVDFYAGNRLLFGVLFGPAVWYEDFGKAMVKMGYIGVKTDPKEGEIRNKCWSVNPKPNPY